MTARPFLVPLALFLGTSAWAQHGGTEAFKQRSKELREGWKDKVRYEKEMAKYKK